MTVNTFTATSLTLKCYAEGSPKPTLSWSKNGQPLESKGRISISDDGTMTIKNTRTHDTGRYRCSARNAIGEASEASSVYVHGNYCYSIVFAVFLLQTQRSTYHKFNLFANYRAYHVSHIAVIPTQLKIGHIGVQDKF